MKQLIIEKMVAFSLVFIGFNPHIFSTLIHQKANKKQVISSVIKVNWFVTATRHLLAVYRVSKILLTYYNKT